MDDAVGKCFKLLHRVLQRRGPFAHHAFEALLFLRHRFTRANDVCDVLDFDDHADRLAIARDRARVTTHRIKMPVLVNESGLVSLDRLMAIAMTFERALLDWK